MRTSRRPLVLASLAVVALLMAMATTAGAASISAVAPTSGGDSGSWPPVGATVVPVDDTRPPSTTMPTGPTTTRPVIGADAVTRDGSPSSTSGQWVFLLVCAVIAGGAGALFLRQRGRRRQSAGSES